MAFAYTIERILEIAGMDARVTGEYTGTIRGIASLSEAVAGDLSFLGNPKYRKDAVDSKASVLLLPMDYEGAPQPNQLQLRVENPSFVLALLCRDIERNLF